VSIALWALPVVPLLAGALLTLAGAVRPGLDRAAAAVGLTISALVLVLAVAVAIARPSVRAALLPGAEASLSVDALSAIMVVTVAVVGYLVLLFAEADLRPTEARARFFGLMLLFLGAMLVTVTATNLLTLLFAWELMGAMSYALVGFWWRTPDRVHAANTAFLVTRGADLGLYLAAGAALAGAGTLAFDALPGASSGWRDAIAAGLVVSALGKSAQLPFSFWLSRAMAGPSPVSALLHSATMVAAGGYLLLRVRPLLETSTWAGSAVAWVGAVTALALGAVAVVQSDLKQLLAASTSAQIGFVVLGAGLGATAGGTMQLVAHAAVKSALFLAAGAWLTSRGTKALRSLPGVARADRVLGVAAGAALLALAGVPPLSLWLTKDSVLAAARSHSLPLYLVGLAGSVLSAAYAGRVLAVVYGRPAPVDSRDVEEQPAGPVPRAATAAVVLLAAAGAGLGVQALPAVERRYVDSLGGLSVLPGSGEVTISALLAVAVVVLVARTGRAAGAVDSPRWRWLRSWLGLEALAWRGVALPTLMLARRLAHVDDEVLHRGVDATAALTRRTALRAAVGDLRLVDGGVRAVVNGGGQLGRLARRPQTGQLHQYYAQAAVALIVLVLLLLIGR